MLRLCLLGHAGGAAAAPSLRGAVTVTATAAAAAAALPGQSRRGYATGARSTARERRYYTQPLRAPQYGTSTVVGRQKGDVGAAAVSPTAFPGEAASPMAEEIATGLGHKIGVAHLNTTTRCMTVHRSPASQLVRLLASRCRSVRYNSAGVPVEGSLLLLPWREKLRLCAAILAAFCMTKALFDVARFELLYYGVWKLGYRNDGSPMKRLLYYGSTAMLAAGLFVSFNVNFFISACVLGRRELVGHMMCDTCAYIVPRRTLHLMASRMGLLMV
ncbi:hypothetical protein NESM_000495600 [Novymonas esmeraldas]|uniref:Uncharacterized protein n=1 Tax=Novymonas esmeraldas TaxID=1808958 RepID=A0AAW0EN91_9TRYP